MDVSRDDTLVDIVAVTRIVAIWKVVEYAGLAAFIVVVPRVMGPALYGRFATLASLTTLLVSASALGTLATFGRFLPEYAVTGDRPKARALFVQLFWTRGAIALLLTIGLLAFLPSLLPGLSWFSFAVTGVALLAGATGSTCFQAFYGEKQFGKWSCQDPLFRLILLVMLVTIGGSSSLDRAVLALGLTNLVVLMLGLLWSGDFFKGERAPITRASVLWHLRFGVLIFAGNLLLLMVWRLGETATMTLSGNPSEAAFFSIANAVVMAARLPTSKVFVMLMPLFTSLHVTGNREARESLAGQALKYVMIASLLAVLATYAAAPQIIAYVLGKQYAIVAANLQVLVWGLPGTALMALGATEAIISQQPVKGIIVNASALSTFIVTAVVLTPRMASVGTSVAVTLGVIVGAVLTCRVWGLAPVLRAARFGLLALLAMISFGVMVLLPVQVSISGTVAATVFMGLLFATGALQPAEMRVIASGLTKTATRTSGSVSAPAR